MVYTILIFPLIVVPYFVNFLFVPYSSFFFPLYPPLGVLPILINLHQIKDKMNWVSMGNVYIGRDNKILKSIWGNPFKLVNNDLEERIESVLKYYIHVSHSDLFFKLDQLCYANYIGCWCTPELCHGDILLLLLKNSVIFMWLYCSIHVLTPSN